MDRPCKGIPHKTPHKKSPCPDIRNPAAPLFRAARQSAGVRRTQRFASQPCDWFALGFQVPKCTIQSGRPTNRPKLFQIGPSFIDPRGRPLDNPAPLPAPAAAICGRSLPLTGARTIWPRVGSAHLSPPLVTRHSQLFCKCGPAAPAVIHSKAKNNPGCHADGRSRRHANGWGGSPSGARFPPMRLM